MHCKYIAISQLQAAGKVKLTPEQADALSLMKRKIRLQEHVPFAKTVRKLIREMFLGAIADYNQTLGSLDVEMLSKLAQNDALAGAKANAQGNSQGNGKIEGKVGDKADPKAERT